MVGLKWNLQFHFNAGQFHFAIPIPVLWLVIPELELELKSVSIPIADLIPALSMLLNLKLQLSQWHTLIKIVVVIEYPVK